MLTLELIDLSFDAKRNDEFQCMVSCLEEGAVESLSKEAKSGRSGQSRRSARSG